LAIKSEVALIRITNSSYEDISRAFFVMQTSFDKKLTLKSGVTVRQVQSSSVYNERDGFIKETLIKLAHLYLQNTCGP
jgi:hypothetical protein